MAVTTTDNSNKFKLATAEEVQQIRDWVKKTPFIPLELVDDHLIQKFYICRDGSLQETKDIIANFFTNLLKLRIDTLDLDLFSEESKTFSQYCIDMQLPKLKENGSIFISYHGLRSEVDSNYILGVMRELRRRYVKILTTDSFEMTGMEMIIDYKNFSPTVLSKIELSLLSTIMSTIHRGTPTKIKSLHYVNMNTSAAAIFKLFYPALSEKIASRVKVHDNLESLHKCIPKECLPKELGGNLGTIEECFTEFRKTFDTLNPIFMKWSETLKKNHGKHIDVMDTASFKKLDID